VAEDQERLIAEALRARGGHGLLSGSDLPLTLPEPTTQRVGSDGTTRRIEPDPRVPVLAVLLFAAMLGLAAGAVVGLLTLL
jgi:hypothetical protein